VSGVAVAARALLPAARVVAVQATGAANLPPSLAAGHPVGLPAMATMADGIAVGRPGELTLAHVAALVDGVVTASEEDLSRALLHCLERAKLVVEPAGAAALAAVLAAPADFEPPVVAVLSGGNIDPLLLMSVIRHELAAAERYLTLRVRLADRPGALAALLDVLGATGANVLDVEHLRTGSDLHLGEVDVQVQVETRGPEHTAAVRAALRGAAYQVQPG
jgi:threonine dehydratase